PRATWGIRRAWCGGLEVLPADRPRAGAALVVHRGRDRDLLGPRGVVGAVGVLPATVGQPGAVVELQTAVEAVTGVDRPVAARLAVGDGIPVEPVVRDLRLRPALRADLLHVGLGRRHELASDLDAADVLAVDEQRAVRDLARTVDTVHDHLGLVGVHRRVVLIGDR